MYIGATYGGTLSPYALHTTHSTVTLGSASRNDDYRVNIYSSARTKWIVDGCSVLLVATGNAPDRYDNRFIFTNQSETNAGIATVIIGGRI